MAEHTLEEAQFANIRLAGTLVRVRVWVRVWVRIRASSPASG